MYIHILHTYIRTCMSHNWLREAEYVYTLLYSTSIVVLHNYTSKWICYWYYESFAYVVLYILVKVPCECHTENIVGGCDREPIKHEVQPSALFSRNHAPSAIFSVMHERERYFNWYIVVAFLASATLNNCSPK